MQNNCCIVTRGKETMADCSCSPDSSTQQRLSKKRRKNDMTWEKSIGKEPRSDKGHPDDIQYDAINSTQDVERDCNIPYTRSSRKSKLLIRFKSKLKHLNLTTYDPILELNEIESDFKDWSNQNLVLNLKSLSELVGDRRQLGKEVFHIINKKEFKKLLPKRLKKYNVRDVRSWCLNEIENTSEQHLSRILKGEEYDPFIVNSNHQSLVQQGNLPTIEESVGSETLTEKDDNTKAVDDSVETGTQKEQDHADLEMKSDPELFQEIIKSPDQNDIDELLNEDVPRGPELIEQRNDNSKVSEKTTEDGKKKNLAILEMEMRARALKSFIKAQEVKEKIIN